MRTDANVTATQCSVSFGNAASDIFCKSFYSSGTHVYMILPQKS